MTFEEMCLLPEAEQKALFLRLSAIRHKAKVVNFSATYKIGADALSRNSGLKPPDAKKLLRIYWERNKAILDVERACIVKEIGHKKWLLNPVNKFYYLLRADKDRFSTLNQGTAAYVFDLWIAYIRKLGLSINFQYHDEFVANIPIGDNEWAKQIIEESLNLLNNKLALNVLIGCSVNFGNSYNQIH